MKKNPVIRALQAGKPQIGTWLSLGSMAAARFMARAGFPWLTVDMEHTHTDIQTAAMMFGAIADAGCVPLARVPTGKHEWIKMVLDCGAMGIVAPMVMDAAEARAIVAATKYPPRGNRSVGGGFHAMNYGATAEEYYRHADDEILVVIQTEHIRAVDDRRRDLRRARHRRRLHRPQRPGLFDALARRSHALEGGVRGDPDPDPRGRPAARVPCGLHVLTAADALRRAREGWQFIAVGSELKIMLDGAADAVRQINPEETVKELAKY